MRRLCAAGEKPQSNRSKASLSSGRDENGDYRIRRADLADFAGRRKPPVARVGFDLTLTVEKSIGLIAMLSDGPRQQRILDALSTANEVAIGYLDRHASVTRRRGETVASEGLLAASYMHATSRALDPHPHFHNVIANAVVDDESGVRALDARALYRHAPAAAALATAAARWELRDLGLGWWRRPEGIWEVAGVDRAAIREFSQRRNDMDEVRRALEERLGRTISHHEEDTVAVSTRADKVASDPAELRESWQDRADRVGLDIDSCFDRADEAIAYEVLPDELHERLFRDLVDSEDGLCARANTFGTGDVMRGIADWSILDSNGVARKVLFPPREVERLTARFCATGLVVEVGVATGTMQRRNRIAISDGQAAPTFTTVELLGVQHRIMKIIDEGLGAGFGQVDAAITGRAISDAKHLSGEQAGLVAAWLTSGDRVQCAIGRAGTGKTTTMRVAASAWTAAGYRVIGAAIKGEAARQLATDAGIETETVAMLLARSRAGVRVLDSRTVLIVDEASTLGDRDLLALCELAIETGATVRLIGDTAQHGSVAAGGTFAELADRDDRVPHLTTVHRLTDPAELKRANLVRSGRASTAIDELVASGQLALTESDGATHAAMVARWYEARAVGRPHPMVHGRNRERRLLNSMAQRLLVDDGIVDGDDFVMLDDGRRLCVGDEVVAKHGDRSIFVGTDRSAWMRNGTTGRVSTVRLDPDNPERDEIDISTDAGTLTCSRGTFDRQQGGIDLAYAMTSYGVQGSTMDVSTSAITASTGRSEMYVDMTRGRHQNQLFGTRPVVAASDDDRHLPTLDTELPEALEARLARGVGATALSLTGGTASVEWAHDLKGLVVLRREGDRSDGLAAAIARASSAIRRVAVWEPPPTLRRLLPSEPTCPHLARRWREVVGEIAVYLAANGPRVRHDQRGLPGVIGSRPATAVGEEWDVVSTVVCRLVSDIVCRQLVDHAGEEGDQQLADLIRQQPDWLSHHLDVLAGAGRLADPNIEELAGTIQRVHHWRIEHRLDETTPARSSARSDAI